MEATNASSIAVNSECAPALIQATSLSIENQIPAVPIYLVVVYPSVPIFANITFALYLFATALQHLLALHFIFARTSECSPLSKLHVQCSLSACLVLQFHVHHCSPIVLFHPVLDKGGQIGSMGDFA